MKGIVEVYGITPEGNRDLVMKKDNLTVVGFAENMVNMFTTPSSTALPSPANDHLLDASNYVIQALSTSKSVEQFRRNQHSYETSNILSNTSFTEPESNLSGWTSTNLTATPNTIAGYKEGVSGTLLNTAASTGVFSQAVYTNGTAGNYDGKFSGDLFNSYARMTFSVDVKWNEDNPPAKLAAFPDGSYKSYTNIRLRPPSSGATMYEVFVVWDSSGGATLAKGDSTDFEGGIKELGGGWHRVFVKGKSGNAGTNVACYVYPCLGDGGTLEVNDIATSTVVDSSAGSIYVARPQVELGRHPTNYVEVSSFVSERDNRIEFSLLNPPGTGDEAVRLKKFNYYVFSGDNGPSLSSVYREGYEGDVGVSAYIPSGSYPTPAPNPDDTVLTEGARTPVEDAFGVEIIKGQNPFVGNSSSMGTLMLSSYSSDWTYTSAYSPAIGRHSAYLGAYVPYSDTASIYINYISGLNYDAYETPLSSTSALAGGIAGGAGQVDLYGHITLSANGSGANHIPAKTSTTNYFYKTCDSDFSSTGEVSYVLHLTDSYGRDAPFLNIFGGVDTLGLWGLDLRAMRGADISVSCPANFTRDSYAASLGVYDSQYLPLDPERRYKLFNKVVLTDNLVGNQGTPAKPGIWGNYKELEVTWRLKFL